MPNLLKAMHTLPIISRTLAAIDVNDLEKLSDAARKRPSPLFLPRLSLAVESAVERRKRSSTFEARLK
jgi:hypothetical protein